MAVMRELALKSCIICTMAGIIRIFWPENSFKPVINTVLLVYIITSVLKAGAHADWQSFAAQLRGWAVSSTTTADYSAYGQSLGLESSVEAIRQALQESGLAASVRLQDGICVVELQNAADRSRAQNVLQEQSGALPYALRVEGETP